MARNTPVIATAVTTSALIFLVVVGYAKASGYWKGNTPESLFFDLIPNAASVSHP